MGLSWVGWLVDSSSSCCSSLPAGHAGDDTVIGLIESPCPALVEHDAVVADVLRLLGRLSSHRKENGLIDTATGGMLLPPWTVLSAVGEDLGESDVGVVELVQMVQLLYPFPRVQGEG